MCFELKRWLNDLHERYEKDIQAIRDSYREADIEFREWKWKVMNDEHDDYDQFSSDDDPVHDNRVLSGECIRPVQDQIDAVVSAPEVYGEFEDYAESDTGEGQDLTDDYDDIYDLVVNERINYKKHKKSKKR